MATGFKPFGRCGNSGSRSRLCPNRSLLDRETRKRALRGFGMDAAEQDGEGFPCFFRSCSPRGDGRRLRSHGAWSRHHPSRRRGPCRQVSRFDAFTVTAIRWSHTAQQPGDPSALCVRRRGASPAVFCSTLVTEAVDRRGKSSASLCAAMPGGCVIRHAHGGSVPTSCCASSRRKKRRWSQCTPRCCARETQRRCRLPWSERVKRSGTPCGRALATPPPALALACHGPSEGKGGGVRLRASQSRGLHHAPRAAGARWPDARFHRSLGRLHASPRR